MSESTNKFKSALLRIRSHANDDHEGDIKENILSIFDSLTKQEKTAILEDVVDTHLAEDKEEMLLKETEATDSVRAELELLKAKDEIKRNRYWRMVIFTMTIIVTLVFVAFAVKSIFNIGDPTNAAAFFSTASELMGIIFGIK